MIHFLYLFFYALFVSIVFAILFNGTNREKVVYGLKILGQFLGVSLVLAWIFYLIPW